tara:strand:- start:3225 stop:3575 length:351 start_codon:yes stop_codon:yes gene_type:complete
MGYKNLMKAGLITGGLYLATLGLNGAYAQGKNPDWHSCELLESMYNVKRNFGTRKMNILKIIQNSGVNVGDSIKDSKGGKSTLEEEALSIKKRAQDKGCIWAKHNPSKGMNGVRVR